MGKIEGIPYKGMELLSAKLDLVFKALLTADGDLELLASLLSCILNLDIAASDLTIMDTELSGRHKNDKLSKVDVKVKLTDGMHINVEIQIENEHNIEKRSIYYLSKMYAGQMVKKMNYSDLRPAVTINILDFNYLPFEEYHNCYRPRNIRNNHELTDAYEINFLELGKVHRLRENSLKDRWMLFLNADSEEELDMLAKEDATFKKAVDKLIYVSADEQLRYDIEMREKWKLDAQSIRIGRERKLAQEITERVTESVTASVTASVTEKVTESVTKNVTASVTEKEREKWQGIVAEKDVALAEKDAEIAELRAKLGNH